MFVFLGTYGRKTELRDMFGRKSEKKHIKFGRLLITLQMRSFESMSKRKIWVSKVDRLLSSWYKSEASYCGPIYKKSLKALYV